MRVNLLRTGAVVSLTTAAMLLAAVAPAVAGTTAPGEGSAYGAKASLTLVSALKDVGLGEGVAVNTGKLAASDTDKSTNLPSSASVADVPLKGLVTARAITSSAQYDAATGNVTSQAKIVDAAVPVLKSLAGGTPTAKVISSTCTSSASGITGSALLVGVDLGSLGKVTVPQNPEKNQTVAEIPGVVKVIANEQITNADGSLTINALHIKLGGGATDAVAKGDVILSSSTCGKAASNGGTGNNGSGNNGSGSQVSVVPAGAPQTGDGSLATLTEG
jgi:hypothetical protein